MMHALATPALRRIQLSWAVAAVGSWGFFVILAVWAYGAGGATAVGVAAFARMVPAGFAAPVAGVLVDRRSRRDVLAVAMAVQAAMLAAIAAAVTADAPVWTVLLLAAAFTVAGTAHRPAQAALLPTLAQTPRQLAAANAVWSAVDNGAFLGGSLFAGALIALFSVQVAFGAAAALLALAVVPVLLVPRDPVPDHRSNRSVRAFAELLGGAAEIARHRDLRVVVGFLTAATLVEGAIDVVVVVVAFSLLGLGDSGVAVLNACWGVGGLVGGLAALGLLARGRLAGGLVVGGLAIGGALVAIAWVPQVGVAIAALALVGVGYALIEAAGVSLLQRSSSEDVLGRAFAVYESSYWLATGAGALLAPLLVAALGVRGALVALGTCLPLVVLARRAAIARLEAGAVVPERAFGVLRDLPLFGPLAIASVEVLAQRAERVDVAPGDQLIREGDRGDRLYVVVSGQLAVTAGGDVLALRGPGEVVGEIALLRDVPRMASVSAHTAGEVLALDRDAFWLALGAHPRVRRAADDLADARVGAAPVGAVASTPAA